MKRPCLFPCHAAFQRAIRQALPLAEKVTYPQIRLTNVPLYEKLFCRLSCEENAMTMRRQLGRSARASWVKRAMREMTNVEK